MKIFKFLIVLSLVFISCEDDETITEDSNSNNEEVKQTYSVPESYVQKGPFIQGSSITVQELNEELNPNGTVFNTSTTDDLGSFELNIEVSTPNLEVIAEGYYFNETTGELDGEITLRNLTNTEISGNININLLTTLAKGRITNLMLNNELSYSEALDQAQNEILAAFNIPEDLISESENFEKMDLAQNGDSNAILLAISLQLQQGNNAAKLSELVAKLSNDFADNGILDNASLRNEIVQNNTNIKAEEVRENISNRNQEIGADGNIPAFEKFIDSDGDGIINSYDFSLVAPSGEIMDSKPVFTWTIPENGFSESVHSFTLKVFDQNTGNLFEEVSGLTENTYSLQNPLKLDTPYNWYVFIQEGENIISEAVAPLSVTFPDTNLNYPESNIIISNTRPTFSWDTISNDNQYTYTIETSKSAEFSEILMAGETDQPTFQFEEPFGLETIYWRVKYTDQNQVESNWSSDNFSIEFPNINADSPTGEIKNSKPTFQWGAAEIDNLTYTIEVSSSNDFSDPIITTSTQETNYTPETHFAEGNYNWRVKFTDENGVDSEWFISSFSFSYPDLIIRLDNDLNFETKPLFTIDSIPLETSGKYIYEISSNSDFSATIENGEILTENFNKIAQFKPNRALHYSNENYFLRVKYVSSNEFSSEWFVYQFQVRLSFQLDSGSFDRNDYGALIDNSPLINFQFKSPADDFDLPENLSFDIQIGTDHTFTDIIEQAEIIGEFEYQIETTLNYSTNYSVRIRQKDSNGITSDWYRYDFNINYGLIVSEYPREHIGSINPTYEWFIEFPQNLPANYSYNFQISDQLDFTNVLFECEKCYNNDPRPKYRTNYILQEDDKIYFWRVQFVNNDNGATSEWVRHQFSTAMSSHIRAVDAFDRTVNSNIILKWEISRLEELSSEITYDIQITDFSDQSFNNIIEEASNLTDSSYETNFVPGLGNGYVWRVRFTEYGVTSTWKKLGEFYYDPPQIEILYPKSSDIINVSKPLFKWINPKDTNPKIVGPITYEIEIVENYTSGPIENGPIIERAEGLDTNEYQIQSDLPNNKYITWRVRFKDGNGLYSYWTTQQWPRTNY